MSSLSYFKLFLDDVDIVSCLSDEDFGRLMRMACDYIRTGDEPNLDGMMRIAFAVFKTKIDSQVETYNKKTTTNQKIAKERKAPSGESGTTSYQNAPDGASISISISNKHKAISNKQEAKAEVKESKDNPPIPPTGAEDWGDPFPDEPLPPKEPSVYEERFEKFWSAYPRKVGKGECRRIWLKLKPSEELTQTMLSAVEAAKGCDQWRRDGGQYIPNPSTWLHQGRWEDSPSDRPEDQPVDYSQFTDADWLAV